MDRPTTGKHVAGSLYIHRDAQASLGESHRARLKEAVEQLPPSAASWNVVRLSMNDTDLSFLSYPTFDSDPFPALAASWSVRADPEWSVTHRDYTKSTNPPILHRKELLLLPNDARWRRFSETTAAAEAIGLFNNSARIGFQREWRACIERSGYELVGDAFIPIANGQPHELEAADESLDVARHRTALSRSSLSAPMQALSRFGLLHDEWTVFDYGCGRGDDIRALREQGFRAAGWDPHYAADEPTIESDVVNIGFVLNVIEDEAERRQALSRAFALTRRVLSVAVMTDKVSSIAGNPFRDGYLTSRNTFQKYFSREAFQHFIESVLSRPPIVVAPGIAFVFPSVEDHEAFLVARQRSSRVWRRADLTRPRRVLAPKRGTLQDRLLEEANLGTLRQFANLMLRLGRTPLVHEASEYAHLIEIGGSLSKVVRACLQIIDADELQAARQERVDDTTVYFALRLLEMQKEAQPITETLREDVRVFFGALSRAISAGRELLNQIAVPDNIRRACESAATQGLGAYDEHGHALLVRSSLVDALPPILRVYVAAGAVLYGDVRSADVVKIHVASGKLTVLEYEDFDGSPIPLLNRRVKINLRTQTVDFFEYGEEFEKTVFLEKSRLLNEEHQDFVEQSAFDDSVRALRYSFPKHGVTVSEFQKVLKANRLEVSGFALVAATDAPDSDELCGASFRYRDFFFCGETAKAELISNLPKSPETYNALNQLARNLLDPVIEYFGAVELTFGFCSPELARAIKRRGVGRIAPALDQHAAEEKTPTGSLVCARRGAAVDFIVRDEDMYEVAQWIADHLPFDRMYIYGPALPIHVSYGPDESRQITYVDRSSGVRPRRIKRPADAPRAPFDKQPVR
ncbi:DNA phosphorothioation-associated putative methyltransferase [Caballeronia zhejiangensis]|uniref:Peptidase M15 n=1 Tax=Caballeronia zhejiangensis TaxID=871203 RepID=A0A656QES5_9BURK|nr:DNA phosphorothioation-associated putative methyltransferase [Caballeronia zhejiangensis]KDR27145.1 peptidase M15 [Caballeronia zhejiangensis]